MTDDAKATTEDLSIYSIPSILTKRTGLVAAVMVRSRDLCIKKTVEGFKETWQCSGEEAFQPMVSLLYDDREETMFFDWPSEKTRHQGIWLVQERIRDTGPKGPKAVVYVIEAWTAALPSDTKLEELGPVADLPNRKEALVIGVETELEIHVEIHEILPDRKLKLIGASNNPHTAVRFFPQQSDAEAC